MPRRPRQGDSSLVALDTAQAESLSHESPAPSLSDRPFVPPASAVEQPQPFHESFSFAHIPLSAPASGGAGLTVQPSLRVSTPGDRFEQEADAVAEQVMRAPDGGAAGVAPAVSAASGGGAGVETSPQVDRQIGQMRGGGSPMPSGDRSFFEQRMGADFGQVRVHTGDHASMVARQLNARAFTVGSDIAFDRGEYAPGTSAGRELLAHELTHTMQQTGGVATKRVQRKSPDSVREADSVAPPEEIEAAESAAPAEGAAAAAPQAAQGAAGPEAENAEHLNPAPVEVAVEPTAESTKSLRTEDVTAGPSVANELQKKAAAGPAQELAAHSEKLEKQAAQADERDSQAGSAAVSEDDGKAQQDQDSQDGEKNRAAPIEQKAAATSAELLGEHAAAAQMAGAEASSGTLDMKVALQVGGFDPTPIEPKREAEDEQPTTPQEEDPSLFALDLGAAQGKFDEIRAQGRTMIHEFMASATGRIQGAVGIGHTIPGHVHEPVAAAKKTIHGAVQRQHATVSARFSHARSAAEGKASAARSHIESQHGTAVSAIQSDLAKSKQQVETSFKQSVQLIQQQEQAQRMTLSQRYAAAGVRFQGIGAQVGAEAISIGNTMAAEYRSHRINRNDSFLDGDLTDRRCEARATVAKQVSEQYQASFVKQGQDQATQFMKGEAQDAESYKAITTQEVMVMTQQHDALIKQLEAAATQAQKQANSARTGLLSSVNSELSATIKSLNAQEASYLQRITSAGNQSCAALDAAGQSTVAALQQNVKDAVSGMRKALADIPSMYSGTQLPNLGSLTALFEETNKQIDEGIQGMHASISEGVASARQHFAQRGADAVQTLGEIAQEASGAASAAASSFAESMGGIQSQSKQSFDGIKQGYLKQSQQSVKLGLDGFSKVVQAANKAFQMCNDRIDANISQAGVTLTNALRSALPQMRADIQKNAEEAAAKEQPRWKGIAKIVLKIALAVAITAVAALVLGPFAIGVAGAAAGALGAGAAAAAVIGEVVGGAVVWGLASMTIQAGSNLIDGKSIGTDLGKAFVTGAIGGAAGGIAGAFIKNGTTALRALGNVSAGAGGGGLSQIAGNVAGGKSWHDGLWQAVGVGALGNLLGLGGTKLSEVITTVGKISSNLGKALTSGSVDVLVGAAGKAAELLIPGKTFDPASFIQSILTSSTKTSIKYTAKYKLGTVGTKVNEMQENLKNPSWAKGNTPPQAPAAQQSPSATQAPAAQQGPAPAATPAPAAQQGPAPAATPAPANASPAPSTASTGKTPTPDAGKAAPTPTVPSNAKAPDPSTKAPDANAKTGTATTPSAKTAPTSGSTKVTGADIAKNLGRPDAPDGYHWTKQGTGDAVIQRNPGMAGTLPQLKYDPGSNDFIEVKKK